MAAAQGSYDRAGQLRPDCPSWRFRGLALCPYVFDTVDAIDAYRCRLDHSLDEALQSPFQIDWRESCRDGFRPPFALAHHGRNNRTIKQKFARLFEASFPQERPPVRNPNRPRVGFLVTPGRHWGFLRHMQRTIERLDRDRFEVAVLCPKSIQSICRSAMPQAIVG